MPHVRISSIDTFDLGVDDIPTPETPVEADFDEERPMTSQSKASTAYGVAVTSPPRDLDERKELPSQRNSIISNRRKSAPGSHTYADAMEHGGPVQEGPILRKGALKENRRSASYNDESKRRSQYYEEQFQYKDGAVGLTREKAQRQSPVIAELKTNVIIKDEFTLVTDLSQHLAQRYNRPNSCIMIKVDHSACLALGGNFDPCYILSISAVPSQMGPSTNKRNTALVQSFMADILSVPSERGIVTFVPISEENLAQNGHTVYGEMEKAEKNEVKRVAESTRKSMTFGKKSIPLLNGDTNGSGILLTGSESSKSVTPEPQVTTMANGVSSLRDRASSTNSKNGRPSTSHGTFDGLRMNPVSLESLTSDSGKTPNGRPKTFGAPEPASIQDELKREPLPSSRNLSTSSVPLVSKATSAQPPSKPPSAMKPDARKATKYTTTPTQLGPRPATTSKTPNTVTAPITSPGPNRAKHQPLIPETRQKNTYLDNVSTLTTKASAANKSSAATPSSPTIVVTPDPSERDRKANTARRRSTITATPKLPPLHPPPPAEPMETKSMSSRLSKRKSFLRMFKRNSIPAWYEQ